MDSLIVHPIDYRYGTKEMKRIWSEESKIKRMIWVEVALLKALARKGYLSYEEVEKVEESSKKITVNRVKEIEAEIKHDVMALVKALSEVSGCKWIHFGATSNDIIDTATATQLRDSLYLIESKLKRLIKILCDKALENKNTVCLGRTHGQAALPVTYGFRFALWAYEFSRHLERLREIRKRVLIGKMSGAVGTQAALGKDGFEIEEEVMRLLNLRPALISSQIVPRDSYCEYIEFLANLATSLEKVATNIRILQRAEVGEVFEQFGEKQVGSSTMPHKRNPIDSENICGLARIVRGFVEPQHQSAVLWEERDLTNSSAERITLVEATVLIDHILTKTIDVLKKLNIDLENVRKNLEAQRGLNLSEAVMIELTKRGMDRQKAHEIVRRASMRAYTNKTSLMEEIMREKEVFEKIGKRELEEILKPEKYIGNAVERVERVVNFVRCFVEG